ncbi:MAG: hypothetical protein IKY67_06530 [Paludibacteraceae bacterium]|nr:hypothetical protein [Paludibacteraceae bacterium]
MTDNEYWIFLEELRRSGETNMYGAAHYLVAAFEVTHDEAREILVDWMNNYNPKDYEGGN